MYNKNIVSKKNPFILQLHILIYIVIYSVLI